MNKILKLNNLQVFILLFLIPFLIQIISSVAWVGYKYTLVLPTVSALLWLLFLIIWLFQLANSLKTKFASNIELWIFRINLSSLFLIYVIAASTFLTSMNSEEGFLKTNFDLAKSISLFINLFAFWTFVYTSYFISKSLAQKLNNKVVKPLQYLNYLIQFIFLPIGIFLLQPMIQRAIHVQDKSDKRITLYLSLFAIIILLGIVTIYSQRDLQLTNKDDKIDEWFQEKALEANQDFANYDDSTKARLLFEGAIYLFNEGKFREAINNMNYSIKLDSSISDYYYNRGIMLQEGFNQIDSAIIDMDKAISIDSIYWQPYQNRGFYYYLKDEFEIALLDIDKVIEINPKCGIAFYLRGEIKLRLEDKIGACKDLRIANDLGNEDALIRIMEVCN